MSFPFRFGWFVRRLPRLPAAYFDRLHELAAFSSLVPDVLRGYLVSAHYVISICKSGCESFTLLLPGKLDKSSEVAYYSYRSPSNLRPPFR